MNSNHRDGRTVLFYSNLRRRKGVEEALEAARLVLEREPTARFLFVGNSSEPLVERRLQERAFGMSGVQFLPAVYGLERDRLLASASILLFPPTEPEGHPRVVLEGLAAGLPVVTTDRGAIAETVPDGVCGFVLDEPVPAQLAERLLLLLRDPELRARMSAAARARYLAHFTQDHADRRLSDWLQQVAKQP
jgi:glycosyltransferase involved in cell wall biosynthesis